MTLPTRTLAALGLAALFLGAPLTADGQGQTSGPGGQPLPAGQNPGAGQQPPTGQIPPAGQNPPSPKVKILIQTVPQVKAEIRRGQKTLGIIPAPRKPFILERPRDSGPLDLVIRAEGYLPVHTRAYTFSDSKLFVKLTPVTEKHTLFGYRHALPADGGAPPDGGLRPSAGTPDAGVPDASPSRP